jgi:hypothetical protein
MSDSGSFEILINGIPRTYRDVKELAVDAARIIKHRERTSEITIIDRNTREWAIVKDLVNAPVWIAPGAAAAKPI